MSIKAGDKVKLISVPPNLHDDDELQTRNLFEECLGQCFLVTEMESVEGLPYPLAKLDVGHILGEEPWKHTIWVEEEHLQLQNS